MSGSKRSNAELLKQLEEKNPLLGLGCSYSPYPVRLWIQDLNHPLPRNSLNPKYP
jgi:hypothetical protein